MYEDNPIMQAEELLEELVYEGALARTIAPDRAVKRSWTNTPSRPIAAHAATIHLRPGERSSGYTIHTCGLLASAPVESITFIAPHNIAHPPANAVAMMMT